MANGNVGSFGRDFGSITVLLYAFGIGDEPPHELGVHEHQRGVLLLGQPQSVFRQTFRPTSENCRSCYGCSSP